MIANLHELERGTQAVCDSVMDLRDNHPIDQYNCFYDHLIEIFNKYSPISKATQNKKFRLPDGTGPLVV